jgi:hypothetical protein
MTSKVYCGLDRKENSCVCAEITITFSTSGPDIVLDNDMSSILELQSSGKDADVDVISYAESQSLGNGRNSLEFLR